jgi:hypothetical protein
MCAEAHPSFQFNQTVRVRSIVLQSSSEMQSPKNIKLLVNRPSLGFEDVEDVSEPGAAQVLELAKEDVKEGNRIVLRFVRFQAVNSLHVCAALSLLIYPALRTGTDICAE